MTSKRGPTLMLICSKRHEFKYHYGCQEWNQSEWMVQGTHWPLMVRSIATSPQQEVMTAVNVTVFWDVALSSPVASYQYFVGSWCLHFQSRGALKMKSMYLSKALVTVYQITWHQNAEDSSNMNHCCENLESHTMIGIQPNLHDRNAHWISGISLILHVMNQWAQCPILHYEYVNKEMCKVQGFVQYNCSYTSVKLCYLGLSKCEQCSCTKQKGSLMLTMRRNQGRTLLVNENKLGTNSESSVSTLQVLIFQASSVAITKLGSITQVRMESALVGARTGNTEKNQWHCQASGSDSLLSPALWDLLRCLSSLSHLSVSFSHNLPEAQTYLVMGYRPSSFCIPTRFPQFNNCDNRSCVGHLLPNPVRKIRDMYVLHNTCSFIFKLGHLTWAAIYC